MDAKTLKNLNSSDSKNNLESSGSASQPNNSMGQHCMVSSRKRKACESLETPGKKQRSACKTTEVATEAVTARGTKRQLSTDRESPKRKRRCSTNTFTSKPTEVPVESAKAKATKRKADTDVESPSKQQKVENTNASLPKEVSKETKCLKETSAEQLPASETPRTTQRESGCDPTSRPCSPSTSKQDDGNTLYTVKTSKDFEAEYVQLDKLGEGGFGSVYAGHRKTDHFPVAIKHIPKEDVQSRPIVLNGNTYMVPTEVLLMQKATDGPESLGKSAAVSLLDWYDVDKEVLLVMERPVPCVDLYNHLSNNKGPLKEDLAKNIMKQLVEASIKLHSAGVFHRDIKSENVLVEFSSDGPRVRVIDFGCGCFIRKKPFRHFSGTSAYAPPEFHIQGSYQAGPTTVWQLGTLLYELLDGHKHFHTSEFLRTRVRFLSELRMLKVSQECQDFVKMCLVLNPRQRATLEQMQLHPWLR